MLLLLVAGFWFELVLSLVFFLSGNRSYSKEKSKTSCKTYFDKPSFSSKTYFTTRHARVPSGAPLEKIHSYFMTISYQRLKATVAENHSYADLET